MGLLESVLGAAMGSMGQGGQQQGGGMGPLVQVLGSLLAGGGGAQQGGGGLGGMIGSVLGGAMGGGQSAGGGLGGLGALLGQLSQGGLGDAVNSWVGTGQNAPVSADQITNALGADRLGQLAQQSGIPMGDLAGQLSQYLPQIIDKLSPQGQLPSADHPDLGGLIGNVLGSVLSRR